MKHLVKELRAYLIDQEICRLPSEEGDGKPCYCEAPAGPPAPADLKGAAADTAVVHLSRVGGMPTPPLHGFYEVNRVEVIVRSTEAADGEQLIQSIADALSDKRRYEMGELLIEESLISNPVQRYPSTVELHGYVWGLEVSLMVRVSNRQA